MLWSSKTNEYLARELDSHIFKEDNILYQFALQVLSGDTLQEDHREVHQKLEQGGFR